MFCFALLCATQTIIQVPLTWLPQMSIEMYSNQIWRKNQTKDILLAFWLAYTRSLCK